MFLLWVAKVPCLFETEDVTFWDVLSLPFLCGEECYGTQFETGAPAVRCLHHLGVWHLLIQIIGNHKNKTKFRETWSVSHGEKQRLRVFENRVLRGKFWFKKGDCTNWLKPICLFRLCDDCHSRVSAGTQIALGENCRHFLHSYQASN
jgi:uncharacterized protein YlaI